MPDDFVPQHAGDRRHDDHELWVLELGRASEAAASLAGISFDLLRVFGELDSSSMYSDPMGVLLRKLKEVRPEGAPPGLEGFIETLQDAIKDRNDLTHALPVAHGLHRRTTKDLSYVRNFFDTEDIEEVTAVLVAASRQGNHLLYHDGGAAVARWYERANASSAQT